jgi:phage terminase small subunit
MAKSAHSAPLNPRQIFFVEEYLIDLNAKEAAIRAGYRRARAASRGYALLRSPQIRAAIAEAMARRADRSRASIAGGITPERMLEEYARIAFSDWRRFAAWGPRGVRFAAARDLSREDTPLIAELVDGGPKRGGLRRVRLFDKQAALMSLGHILLRGDRARFAGAAPCPLLPPFAAAPAPQASARQRRFAEEYLTDFNAYAAARRAGYSERTAALNMTKIKRQPATAALIAALIERRAAPIRAEADRVLAEYARIAFADIGRLADWNHKRLRLKPKRRIAIADSAAIERIDSFGTSSGARGVRLRLTLHDKVYALDMLARHLGLLEVRVPGGARKQNYAAQRTSAALRARLGRR